MLMMRLTQDITTIAQTMGPEAIGWGQISFGEFGSLHRAAMVEDIDVFTLIFK